MPLKKPTKSRLGSVEKAQKDKPVPNFEISESTALQSTSLDPDQFPSKEFLRIFERSNKLSESLKTNVTKFQAANAAGADVTNLKNLMGKCQLASYSANFLVHICESLESMESTVAKNKRDFRVAQHENKELKASMAYTVQRIHDIEAKNSASEEKMLFWKTNYNMHHLEFCATMARAEQTCWNDSKVYETNWNSDAAGTFAVKAQALMEMIPKGLNKRTAEEIAKLLDTVIEEDEQSTFASQLEQVAKLLYEERNYAEAETLMTKVMTIRRKVYGVNTPITMVTQCCIAIIQAGQKNYSKAIEMVLQALELLEKAGAMQNDKCNMVRLYTSCGCLFISWGRDVEGIKLLQLALNEVEGHLPKEEYTWSELIATMARACNDAEYHDDAMAIACELLDYYHEKRFGSITEKNPTVYEIAYAIETNVTAASSSGGGGTSNHTSAISSSSSDSATGGFRLPDPVYLPPSVLSAMKEVAIAYACRYEFRAANCMMSYIETCTRSCQEEPNALGNRAPEAFRDKARRAKVRQSVVLDEANIDEKPRSKFTNFLNIATRK